MIGRIKELQEEAHNKLIDYMVEHALGLGELRQDFNKISLVTLADVISEEKCTQVRFKTSLYVLKVLREKAALADTLKAAANENKE